MTKIILVVFDGCRPDGLAEAHTPNVDALWQSGAYSWTAQSVTPSVTLPTHLLDLPRPPVWEGAPVLDGLEGLDG
jgi:hypothetical protein